MAITHPIPIEAPSVCPKQDSTRRDALFNTVVLTAYLALGLLAYAPLRPWSSNLLFGTGGDSVLATWFLAWIPHSLSHGLNPLFSQSILYPSGVNLAQNTTAPFLGLLTVPLSLIMGPIARSNFLLIIAMPISASAAYLTLRKWRVSALSSAIGGLIYGFSPFAIGQGLGHVVLVFLPFPPLIAWAATALATRESPSKRLSVLLGLLLAGQFLSEPEVFVILILVAVGVTICVTLRHPRRVAQRMRQVTKPLSLSLAVMALVMAYPVWMELLGPQHYIGTAQPISNPYYNDLLSFIHPGPLQRVSLGMKSLSVPLSNVSEAGSYIGLPMLLITMALAWRSRRSHRMQVSLVFTGIALVLSLGRRLVVDGHVTQIRLPFDLLVHLPLLGNILPSRFSLAMFLGLAGIIAFGLDDLYEARAPKHALHSGDHKYRRRGTLFGVAILAVLAVTQLPDWPYPSMPVKPLPAAILRAIPAGTPNAVTYPYPTPYFSEAQLWQVEGNFSFNLLGGYAEHPDSNGRSTGIPNPLDPPGLGLFLEGQEGFNSGIYPPVPVTASLLSETRQVFARYDIRFVIVNRSAHGAGPAMTLFQDLLGIPTVTAGQYALWSSTHGHL